MKLFAKEHILELKHQFTISRYSFKTKPTLIVTLTDGNYTGLGEASSNPYYNITTDKMIADLYKVQNYIESTIVSEETPSQFWAKMHAVLKHNMFALSALDLAYHDLYTKQKKQKLYEYWQLDISNNPITNFTIGIDSVENMLKKMEETPFPIYKIKLGTKEDIKIIQALRKKTDAIFRIDANCAWTAEETIKNAITLKELGVEFLEQPLPAENWEEQKLVFEKSVLPIIADESCLIETDVEKCHGYFHGVNIKLTKCGGLSPAKRMIDNAKQLGLKTMVGCMTESSVGISAIAHLLPKLDYVDMDGALLLEEDIATGITIKNGIVHYKNVDGIGATLL